MELSQKWAKNREKLPKCNYQIPEKDEKEIKKYGNEEGDNDNEDKSKHPLTNFGKMIRDNYMPEINEIKKKQREDIIFILEDPKGAVLQKRKEQLEEKERKKKEEEKKKKEEEKKK